MSLEVPSIDTIYKKYNTRNIKLKSYLDGNIAYTPVYRLTNKHSELEEEYHNSAKVLFSELSKQGSSTKVLQAYYDYFIKASEYRDAIYASLGYNELRAVSFRQEMQAINDLFTSREQSVITDG